MESAVKLVDVSEDDAGDRVEWKFSIRVATPNIWERRRGEKDLSVKIT